MKEKILHIPSTQITIRKLLLEEEFEAAFAIQSRLPEFCKVGLIPSYYMKLVGSRGGLVLGCFDKNQLVGYNFAFPCVSSSLGIYLFADSMGFLPAYQRKHLGYYVKKLQYSLAITMRIRYIVWTYDPLKGVNANINIRKLGARIVQYLPEQYKTMGTTCDLAKNRLQKTVPEDRFEVCWDVLSDEVKRRMENPYCSSRDEIDQIPIINPTLQMEVARHQTGLCLKEKPDLMQKIASIQYDYQSPVLRFEIPINYNDIEEREPSLAIDWRIKSRQVFQKYFQNSYQIEEFCHQKKTRRNFYILKKVMDPER
jgi:chorismate synthase